MLVSLLLSLKSTVFLPVVHRHDRCSSIITDALPLISGRGLKILRTDHLTSWPPHIQYASAAYGLALIRSSHTMMHHSLNTSMHAIYAKKY